MVGLSVVVAVAAITFAVADLSQTRDRSTAGPTPSTTTATSAPSVEWRALPQLPDHGGRDIDGAAVTNADDSLYAAVVDRAPRTDVPSRVAVYRLGDGRWHGPIGGRPLPLNRDGRFDLLGGERPCVVLPQAQRVHAWCVSESGRWEQLGPAVFDTTYPRPDTTFAGAFRSQGRVYVLRADIQRASQPSGANRRRLEHRVLRFDGRRWSEPAMGDIDPGAAQGSQRVSGLTWDGRTCVAYDRLGGQPGQGPSVHVRCLEDGRWSPAGPALDLSGVVGAPNIADREAINLDGAVAVDGILHIGVDHFRPEDVDWSTLALHDKAWSPTPLGGEKSPTWDAQGSLHEIGGQVWAVRFDQRPSSQGLRATLVVRALGGGGHAQDVGAPLIRDARLYGPLYWGLAEVAGSVYAIATIPRSRAARNELQVFRLRTAVVGPTPPG